MFNGFVHLFWQQITILYNFKDLWHAWQFETIISSLLKVSHLRLLIFTVISFVKYTIKNLFTAVIVWYVYDFETNQLVCDTLASQYNNPFTFHSLFKSSIMLSECKGRSLHANKKQNWAGLWTNNCATIQQVLTLKFPLGPKSFRVYRETGPRINQLIRKWTSKKKWRMQNSTGALACVFILYLKLKGAANICKVSYLENHYK